MSEDKSQQTTDFGKRLKALRKQKDLSQQDIGELTGRHFTNISRYERGLAMPNAETLRKLSEALGVSGDYLMDGKLEDGAKARLDDRELLYQFQQVQKLPTEDKMTVKKLLEAFIFQRTVQGLASGQAS